MSGSIPVLLSGAALGLSIAAPPGPVTALAVQEVVSRSWFSGWLVTFGATVADGVFFVLTYYGVARMVTTQERSAMFVLGGALMLYLASSTLRTARTPVLPAVPSKGSAASSGRRSPFLVGLSIGLTNPYQLGWWFAIGAGMVAEFGESVAVGFFVGIVVWTVFVTGVVHTSVTRYARTAPAIAYASAALMVAFGLWFLDVGLTTVL